jgi:hypothetical protein
VKYASILELKALHSFYADATKPCPDVNLVPTAETVAFLAKHRCRMRNGPGIATVFTELDGSGAPFPKLTTGRTLRFSLVPMSTDFELYTDVAAIRAAPVYSNATVTAASGGTLVANAGTNRTSKALADIEIILHANVGTNAATPAKYTLSLGPKKLRWAYYIVTGLSRTDADNLSITDTSASGPLTFATADRKWLNEARDDYDSVGMHLVQRNPGKQVLRFVSSVAVACYEQPRKTIELKLKTATVVKLSNPSIRSFSRYNASTSGQAALVDAVNQIIEYKTSTT